MDKKYKKFSSRLLDNIVLRNNDKVKSMLSKNKKLVNAHDGEKTLLYHAAAHNNHEIARHLIEMGSVVDAVCIAGKTPLMRAVLHEKPETVRVLLDAGASIDLLNDFGKSALHMVFDEAYNANVIVRIFLKKVKAEAASVENFIAKMTSAGCSLFHAAKLRDTDLFNSMLQNGLDINSRGPFGRTAVFAAVEAKDFNLIEGLLKIGADIDARDNCGNSALSVAASEENKVLLEFLLERGADLNARAHATGLTPLFRAVAYVDKSSAATECIELLLRHGAIPQNSLDKSRTIFDFALTNDRRRGDYLVAQLALLENRGYPIDKSMIRCDLQEHKEKVHKLLNYYRKCQQVLGTVMFQKLTLGDLLNASDFKMRTYVRNEEFIPSIKKISFKQNLIEYPYYYNSLMKYKVNEATDCVKLEDIAIPIICRLFNRTKTQCYDAMREIVGYLKKRDLDQLVKA